MINSNRKGKRVERALAALLRDHGFVNARRGQQYKGTRDSADVVDAIPGVHCESKGVKSMKTLHRWIEKCEAECAADEDPAVFIRADRKRPLVVLDAKDYLDLMAELIERRQRERGSLHHDRQLGRPGDPGPGPEAQRVPSLAREDSPGRTA